jgi:hypothetical protein
VQAPPFTHPGRSDAIVLGRHVLQPELPSDGGLTLRLCDVHTGEHRWRRTWPEVLLRLRSADRGLTGVIDPKGVATVLDARTGKELARLQLDPAHVRGAQQGTLLHDRTQFFVAVEHERRERPGVVGPSEPAFQGVGEDVPINGRLYAFDRATGELRWTNQLRHQSLVLDQFEESPLVVAAAREQRLVNPTAGESATFVIVQSIDKRTGKLVYTRDFIDRARACSFHGLYVHRGAGAVDLVGTTLRLRHQVRSE